MATEFTVRGLLSPIYSRQDFQTTVREVNLAFRESHEFIMIEQMNSKPQALSMHNILVIKEVDDEHALFSD